MKSVAIPTSSMIMDNYAHPRIIGRPLDVFYNEATPDSLYIAGFSEANTLVCYGYKLYDDGKYKLYDRFQYEIKIWIMAKKCGCKGKGKGKRGK